MKIQRLRLTCAVGFLLGALSAAFAADEPLSPEQKELNRFLGAWRTTYTISKSEWTPEDLSGGASMTFSRVLGDRFVEEQSQHADGKSNRAMYTYDEKQQSYRAWWFSSIGQANESVGEWDPGTKSFTWKILPKPGERSTTTTRHQFSDANTMIWSVLVTGDDGKTLFQMKGKAVRSKD